MACKCKPKQKHYQPGTGRPRGRPKGSRDKQPRLQYQPGTGRRRTLKTKHGTRVVHYQPGTGRPAGRPRKRNCGC